MQIGKLYYCKKKNLPRFYDFFLILEFYFREKQINYMALKKKILDRGFIFADWMPTAKEKKITVLTFVHQCLLLIYMVFLLLFILMQE